MGRDNLTRRYRYKNEGNRIRLEPVPQGGLAAMRFIVETHRICKNLYGVGASLDAICGSQYGGLIFQSGKQSVNRYRAREVARLWREAKRKGIIR